MPISTISYTVTIDRVSLFRASTVSPFTGHEIVRYADTQDAANNLIVEAIKLEASLLGYREDKTTTRRVSKP